MYEILSKYPGDDWEIIDEAETKAEAEYMLTEYRIAFGPEFYLMIRERRR